MIEIAELWPGQLVRNLGSGQVYQVLEIILVQGQAIPVLVRTVTLTNPQEWELTYGH